MSTHPIPASNRILLIDDNPAIHDDFRKILCPTTQDTAGLDGLEAALFGTETAAKSQTNFQLESAYQGREGLAMVEAALAEGRPYSLAFVDVRMPPGWDGIETVRHIWKSYPELQVVICTAYSDYSWEEIIQDIGQTDQLVILKKPFDNIEVLQLAHALTQKWLLVHQARLRTDQLDALVVERTSALQSAHDRLAAEIRDHAAAQHALRVSEDRFSRAFNASPISLAIQRFEDGALVNVNQSFADLVGIPSVEILGLTPQSLLLFPNDTHGIDPFRVASRIRNAPLDIAPRVGTPRKTLVSTEPFLLGEDPHILVMIQDITEKSKVEDQLRQSQKMEAIGQLAAGVAHDFNNILTIIQGHASIQIAKAHLDEDVAHSMAQIARAAERAGALTRQLLAFSRCDQVRRELVDVDALVADSVDMIRRLVGAHMTVEIRSGGSLPAAIADSARLGQILLNLAANARDSMPDGGTITIATSEVVLHKEDLRHNPESMPGRYIRLAFTDTGIGMDDEVLSHIFDPFYTTKEIGKGTGMGLATVYGIVKQHLGWIEVESAPGQGSTFTLHFPAAEEAAQPSAPAEPTFPETASLDLTILLIEDEPDVRQMASAILAHCGYSVIEAGDVEEAQNAWARYGAEVDAVVTDIMIPGGLTGVDLAERMIADRPGLPVIYTSGYSPDFVRDRVTFEEGLNFLPKPYPSAMLARTLGAMLEKCAMNRQSA